MAAGKKNKGLLEWVAFTVIAAITGLAGIFIPPLSFLCVILLPIPVMLLVLRLDARYGILGLTTAGFFMLFAGPEPAMALVLIVQCGLLGIVYGLLFKNNVSSGKCIIAGILTAAFLTIVSVAVVFALTRENLLALGQESRLMLEQWAAANLRMWAFDNLLPGQQADLIDNLVNMFELFIPGQLVVNSAISAVLTYFLSRFALGALLKYKLPPAPVFSTIYLPWYSIWGMIAGLGLTLLGDYLDYMLPARAGKNILFVLFYIYLAFGLSVATYLFRRINFALPVKMIFLLIAISYLPYSMAVLFLLGAVDPLINIRRLPELKE
ncbi:MAG: hypothetical protein A4E55_00751 [Pelotomaculum sp. PtaU1.Bin035]|nr:MAG: hypothetical protein A4E55_00751 [Pelotomaculum sp. PtaU1.Bin035]